MLGRAIIIVAGGGLAATCAAIAVLTIFHIYPPTAHLEKFYIIGYAAVNAVLIPFGVAGFIGGVSRKKTLIKAFVTFQWWLVTLILTGLNIFNFILSENCKGKPCSSKQAAFIDLCAQGGAMVVVGSILVVVGRRVYSNLRLEEETKSLLAKANFNEKNSETNDIGRLSPNSSNSGNANANANANDSINTNNNIGRYETNVIRQPSKATMVNEDLVRRPTNANINATQNPSLRNQPDPNFVTPYNGLSRNQTTGNIPPKKLARYPTNATDSRVNVTRQPTIGNAYAPRNYVGTRQATYPPPSQPIYSPPPPSQAAYPPQSQAAYPPQSQAAYPQSQAAYPPPPQSQAAYPPVPPSQAPYPVPPSQAPYPVAPLKATYSIASSQRSLSTNPPSPSYITQVVIPPPPVSKANNNYNDNYGNDYNVDYNEYDDYDSYKPRPYAQTKAPQLTRMGMNNNI